VLRKGLIDIVGLAPNIQSAIDGLPMGLLAKIPLVVPGLQDELKQFLPEGDGLNQATAVIHERPGVNSLYFVVDPWNPALVIGFVGGSYAWDLSEKGAAGIPAAVDRAEQGLAEMLGCRRTKVQAEAATLTDWAWNQNTLGGYTSAAPGHFAARAALGLSQDNRLFFAGEALGKDGWYATCHGAYDSGYEVAGEAIKHLPKT
jgi:monoamine oxidase